AFRRTVPQPPRSFRRGAPSQIRPRPSFSRDASIFRTAPKKIREAPENAGGGGIAPRLRAIADREVGDERRADVDGEAGVGPLLEPRRNRRKQQHHADELRQG